MVPTTRKNSGGKTKAAKASKSHRFAPIPKRVTKGFRVPFNYYEWTQLVEAWYSAKVHGYPNKETIVGLALHFERCVKQINTFYANRRQDVANKVAKDGKITEDELHDLLWEKYKGTIEERQVAKQRGLSVREASCSSSKFSSPAPSLTLSEGSSTDSAISEASVESVCSVDAPVVVSDCSEWSNMVTPAMAALLQVVNDRLAELEVDKPSSL